MSDVRSETTRVAVIGGGVAGATAALHLTTAGQQDPGVDIAIAVFDKGRGPGGRCSTRRADDLAFDHGAQYFTADSEAFRKQVDVWQAVGAAVRWEGQFFSIDATSTHPEQAERYVGTPGMNAIVRSLLNDVDVRFDTLITQVSRTDGAWNVQTDAESHAGFDELIVALPATQAAPLLASIAPQFADVAAATAMHPCLALMVAFETPLALPFDGAKICGRGPIAWVARNSSKPGRPPSPPDCWVVHADRDWSMQHVELDREAIAEELHHAFIAFCHDLGVTPPAVMHQAGQRWRYALAAPQTQHGCLRDTSLGLTVCGDWLVDGKIEGAFLSGAAAAENVLNHLAARSNA